MGSLTRPFNDALAIVMEMMKKMMMVVIIVMKKLTMMVAKLYWCNRPAITRLDWKIWWRGVRWVWLKEG